jgi:predicted AAA+ superfamily ATPase
LIQVSQTLEDKKTKQRELRALIKAKNELKASDDAKLYIITMDDASVETIDNNQIQIINILEWLLEWS